MGELDRITFNPNVMGGRACIRGLRVTVSLILKLAASRCKPSGSVVFPKGIHCDRIAL